MIFWFCSAIVPTIDNQAGCILTCLTSGVVSDLQEGLRSQISELMMFNDNDVQQIFNVDLARRHLIFKIVKSNKELSCIILRYKKGTRPSDFAELPQQKSPIAH
jgi:hypothetical protein